MKTVEETEEQKPAIDVAADVIAGITEEHDARWWRGRAVTLAVKNQELSALTHEVKSLRAQKDLMARMLSLEAMDTVNELRAEAAK